MNHTPPSLITKFIQHMFNRLDMEEVEGDLREDFEENVRLLGVRRARLKYAFNALRLTTTYLSRRKKHKNQQPMKTNLSFYLKYGLRSIFKHKFYHTLNVASLTLGFSCFILIYLFVINQSQRNSFLVDQDRIVRLSTINPDKESTALSIALPPVLKEDFPEIESFSRYSSEPVEISKQGDNNVFSEFRISAEPDFLDIFQLELLVGQNIRPGSQDLLISERFALKLWADVEQAMEQELIVSSNGRESKLTVVGILKNSPINSSFSIDLFSGASFYRKFLDLNSRLITAYPVFFKVRAGTDLDALARKIPEQLKKYTENESYLSAKYIFRTIDDIRYNPNLSNGFIEAIDSQALLIFKIVGLIVLVLAVANYMNISAALTLKRVQEAGIRRVMGASRKSIIVQQLSESMIVGLVSVVLSAIVLILMIQSVQNFIGLSLTFEKGQFISIAILGMGFLLTIVLIGSIYPALLLSRFKYREFVQGKLIHSPNSKWMRSLLLIIQFSIATFLITGTFTFFKQLDFINDSHKKGSVSNILLIEGELGKNPKILRQRINSLPEINKLSISTLVPEPDARSGYKIGTPDFNETFSVVLIDEYFMDIMKIDVVEGVDFYRDERSRPNHFLINQTMAKTVNEGHPLNQEYNIGGKEKKKIIGIIEDFPVRSLKDNIRPTAYLQAKYSSNQSRVNTLILDITTDDMSAFIHKVEKIWNEILPEEPFAPEFLDERINSIYESEIRLGKLFNALTIIAIVIACLGIFGLLSYMVQIKTKEIGIRKVLGANFYVLARLLTQQVWGVLFLSGFIAFPLSYYFLEQWLNSFVYKADVTWDLYVVTLISFITIIAVTVFSQVKYAASLNPSDVLRNE